MDRKIFIVVFWILTVWLNIPGQDLPGDSGSVIAPEISSEDILERLEKEDTGSKGSSVFNKILDLLGLKKSPVAAGKQAYEKEDYDVSLQKFMEAKLERPESPELAFNIGNAQFKKKKYDEAIKAYQEALNSSDATLSSSAYYNLGNAYFRQGEFAVQQGNQQGIQDYRSAMANYKKSLDINPDNQNAKRNIEVVQARIKELLDRKEQEQQDQNQQQNQQPPPKPSEKAKEVLARALQMVKERKYDEAKRLLETIIQEDETAVSFQQYVKRIDDVINILDGIAPSPPVQQDPRSQQQGMGVI